MRKIIFATLLALFALCAAPASAADTEVGIVLLHGKWDREPTHVQDLARQLEAQGFRVATPTMPWSRDREYDVPYPQALDEISSAAQALRDKGAKHIVIGGQSMGAN